ncbi:hypothetical protein EN852_033630 [Mesorhizobium sp. M2E.F.Ca.ET.209.01.1.1]|uniref:hypothetical protein n=1 Tax=Mesorhizobium sp. M2E.F.Ca.ET.209.01.1.1 TaxID=2500526 RepID=UPI000FD8A669|nr:hypothetical protein [Mesorhizobium sp. M2E.F.Ca.ET.209.01.1.1]TGS08819.1 hypothetical protein EN852_033630 [Mesorhizobium sp. M2E.F.Ca.ET.209.01.1.1]
MVSHAVIASLPVAGADRTVLIDAANAAFEAVLEQIEPNNESLTRSLWDAGDYVDNQLFVDLITPDKLPMRRDEVAYYIDVFLVHHVIGLATAADREAAASRS